MKIITAKDIKHPFNIAIVISRFNEDITQRLFEGAIQRLKELEIKEENITIIWVPGAVEVPLVAQQLAQTDNFAAIIALGAVIRGQTNHYDYVCKQVSDGCQKVALEFELPVIFGILTTENHAQALDRSGGAKKHMGRDAVDAAFEMISVMEQLESEWVY